MVHEMEMMNDIRVDWAPDPSYRSRATTPFTTPKRTKKVFADKEVQCQLPTNSHSPDDPFCECKDVHIISSNDQYNTNFKIKGNNHDVCIGQVFHGHEMNPGGLENGSIPPSINEKHMSDSVQYNSVDGKSHEVTGHYHTTLQFAKPQNNKFTFEIQTQNYSPTFQLDATATREILLSNPEIIQALALNNAFSLSESSEDHDKENSNPNVKTNGLKSGKDIHECLYENRINAERKCKSRSNNLSFSNRTVIKIEPNIPNDAKNIFCGSNSWHSFTKVCLRKSITCSHCNCVIDRESTAFVCQECSCYVDTKCRQEIIKQLAFVKDPVEQEKNKDQQICLAILQEGLFWW